MHTYVKTLQKVADRYAPSRMLSFDMVHVFKTLQLIQENGHVSREKLCEDLGLGEGTIKTLVRHLKMQNLIESTNAGTKMTKKGIIGSDNYSRMKAEFAAKSAALVTIMNHEKH